MSNLYHDNSITVAELTKKLASRLIDAGLRLTTAESCTGGKLSVALCAEERTLPIFMMWGWSSSAIARRRGSPA